jgi:hypothetical protein
MKPSRFAIGPIYSSKGKFSSMVLLKSSQKTNTYVDYTWARILNSKEKIIFMKKPGWIPLARRISDPE